MLSDFLNPFVQARVEPGSVIKPLTLAAALDTGAITPETTYYDKGYREFDTERINNFDKKGRGTVTMQDVLSQSLNTGAVFAMERLGKEKFLIGVYFISFSINSQSEILKKAGRGTDRANPCLPPRARNLEFVSSLS